MTALFEPGISRRSLATPWKIPLFQMALVWGWLFLLYRETVWSMVSIWARSETFAHGFVVLPIALWLAWRQRQGIRLERPTASWPAVALLLGLGSFWLAGYLVAANAVTQFALVGLLVGSVPALLGWRVARRLAFPLGFLLFAVPFGEFMLPSLMEWTARFTVLGLRLTGVPVYREGLDFVIPTGAWSVVEACSGIRYLIASVMAGSLFAYLNYRSLRRRLLFVGLAMLVPLVANWLRAYLIVMLGHLSGNELATGADHLVYGWLFFGVVIGLMFYIGTRWREAEAAPGPDLSSAAMSRPPRGSGWLEAAMTATAVALPILVAGTVESFDGAAVPVLAGDGRQFAGLGWLPVGPAAGGAPVWTDGGRQSWQENFEKAGLRAGLHIAYYRHQSSDRKLNDANGGLPAAEARNWQFAAAARRRIALGGEPATVNEAILRPRLPTGGEPMVLWQWYWADGRMTPSPLATRIDAAWSRLRGRGDDSALIVLYAPAGQAGGAEAALEAFSREAGGAITRILNETRSRR